tara:strand:+ start:581 stop:790 length:210 start_codon:yes stop_codon:yes gene_type:complete
MRSINNIVNQPKTHTASSKIVEYPFLKKTFTYGEYINWKQDSPKFTMEDYNNYKNVVNKSFVYYTANNN